jgi:hypothetical protein
MTHSFCYKRLTDRNVFAQSAYLALINKSVVKYYISSSMAESTQVENASGEPNQTKSPLETAQVQNHAFLAML